MAVSFLWVRMAVFTLSPPAVKSLVNLCAQPPMLLDTAPRKFSSPSTVRAAQSTCSALFYLSSVILILVFSLFLCVLYLFVFYLLVWFFLQTHPAVLAILYVFVNV